MLKNLRPGIQRRRGRDALEDSAGAGSAGVAMGGSSVVMTVISVAEEGSVVVTVAGKGSSVMPSCLKCSKCR